MDNRVLPRKSSYDILHLQINFMKNTLKNLTKQSGGMDGLYFGLEKHLWPESGGPIGFGPSDGVGPGGLYPTGW